MRTLPWVQGTAEKYAGKDLTIIGIHSPEFDYEKSRDAIESARRKHGLTYTSYIDNDFRYWRSLDNRYWPTIYLVDRKGEIRMTRIGEVHDGDAGARALETAIDRLLAESP